MSKKYKYNLVTISQTQSDAFKKLILLYGQFKLWFIIQFYKEPNCNWLDKWLKNKSLNLPMNQFTIADYF